MPWIWPLRSAPLLPDVLGSFGVPRLHDIHTGVDLYTDPGTEVLAVEEGEVVAVESFTGDSAGSPWWNDTQAVLVEGASGVVVYGEVQAGVAVGARLKQGDVVGAVEQAVLKKFKGRPMVMLHLELLEPGERKTHWWIPGGKRPPVLDPTPYLRQVSRDIQIFDVEHYDGVSFRPCQLIPSAIAVVRRGMDVLMLRRHPSSRTFAGRWCFPGGRLDPGETPTNAVIRELEEETGLRGEVVRCLGVKTSLEKDRRYLIYVFEVTVADTSVIDMSPEEHDAFAWVSPVLSALPTAGPVTEWVLRRLPSPRGL